MAKSTAIRVGVRDLWVAKATTAVAEDGKTTVSYEKPQVIGGTASIGVSHTSGQNKVYESDVPIRDNNRITGATISYKSRTVSLEDELKVLYGVTGTGEFEDGPDDIAPVYAVGWAAPRSDGSFACVWYYYTTGSKGDETFETATDTESSPEDEYKFAAIPCPGTRKLRRRAICADEAAMLAFFASVLKTAA